MATGHSPGVCLPRRAERSGAEGELAELASQEPPSEYRELSDKLPLCLPRTTEVEKAPPDRWSGLKITADRNQSLMRAHG